MRFKKVYIEITNICNKNCSFCSKSFRKKEEMNVKNFEYILNQVKEYTDYIYLHVKGEPLLHSKFDEILTICDNYNIKVNITTNGSCLLMHQEKIIDHNCVRQINISTHSISIQKDMSEIIDAVEYIKKHTKIYFVYRYWTLKENYIAEDNLVLNVIKNYYNLSEQKEIEIKEKKNIKIDGQTYINKDIEFEWPSLDNNTYNEGYCYGLKTHIAILSNGIVVPCCLDAEGAIELGNILNTPLKDILDNEKTQKIINGFKNNVRCEELCKHCSFKK